MTKLDKTTLLKLSACHVTEKPKSTNSPEDSSWSGNLLTVTQHPKPQKLLL